MTPPFSPSSLRFRYMVKALLPKRVEIRIRQILAQRKLASVQDVWPILETAGTPPPGWTGWPDGKEFAFVLSHDVDTQRGLDRCLQIAAVEERLGFRSAFYFVPNGRYEVPESLRDELVSRGFEVGVHGLIHDWRTFTSRRVFERRAPRINQYLKEWGAVGFRAPSMIRNLKWIGELDVSYDASTFDTDPFEPQPEGVGTIFPFWVEGYGSRPGYVEIPYTLPQDYTLFVLLQQKSCEIWKRKLAWIAQKGGMASCDVHPCYAGSARMSHDHESYPLGLYEEFLQHVERAYTNRYWHVLPAVMARFCKENRKTIATRTLRRVCMMAYAFYDTDNRIIRYAETLVKRGDEVDVISLRRPGHRREEMVNGVRVFRIQERQRNERFAVEYLWRLLRFLISSSRWLSRLHRANPYDLIHVHSVPDFEVFAAWPAKRRGARVVLDIHDIVPEFYASKFKKGTHSVLFRLLVVVERWSTGFVDKVIIANHIWQKRLVERSVSADKCIVVLNYVDTGTFQRRARQRTDDRFLAVYPGGLQWHQGLDIAVRAFAWVKQTLPKAELHIYGDGSERESLVRLVDELAMGQTVFIHGMVPHDQVAQVMADADFGIVPKRADSFGNEAYSTKILEFMSQGIPVIASRTLIDTFYFREPAVKFFESGNEADLTEKILEVARDGDLRRRMVAAADVCLAENSWAVNQQEYLDLVDGFADVRSVTS